MNESTKAGTMESNKWNSINEKQRNGNYSSNNRNETETERGSGLKETTQRVLINENANVTTVARHHNSINNSDRSIWNMIDD